MRWKRGRRSQNIEDRRGQRPTRMGMGGGGNSPLLRLLPMLLGRRFGKYGIFIVLAIVGAQYLGINIPFLSGNSSNFSAGQSQSQAINPAQQELADFVSVVLADTEDTWNPIFQQLGKQYKEPRLVLFSGSVRSACGMASSAVGPFYCPADQKVYIDLSFYNDLKNRHGAPGDFAQAYVIAHEVGHHVQTLLGISNQVHQAKSKMSKVQANQLSVRQELQADCFSGIWAHHANRARQVIEPGDIEEALTAASAIGDDTLQKQAQGYVRPESFTHGSAEQRVRWFKQGLQTGNVKNCDTFNTSRL
ncbi:MAG: KPN_02809 family neutral zinc metallopeptidase [Cellvibrionaceae bacterium]